MDLSRLGPPVLVVEHLPEERQHLLSLLDRLSERDWRRPTACPGWTVKDVALHLLGDDVGVLSRLRDRYPPPPRRLREDLVSYVNRLNAVWVRAARRMSTRVLCDLLRLTGEQTFAYFASLDPYALGEPVSWAGPEPAPAWLGIAREYTERWVHQQQIREAVGAPELTCARLFGPVLATFARALPHTFRDVVAPVGTTATLVVDGEAGGRWSVVHTDDAWTLRADPAAGPPDALVRMDQDTAWRLFTKGITEQEAGRRAVIEGDRRLGERVLRTVAIVG